MQSTKYEKSMKQQGRSTVMILSKPLDQQDTQRELVKKEEGESAQQLMN